MTSTTGELNIVQRLLTDRPLFHLGGEAHWDAAPGTLEAIFRFARPGDATIETGVGASTVIFAACGADHTAISPDGREHQLVRDYCQRIGIDDSRINFTEGLSDDILPALLGRDRSLDMAFIDGAHSFPFPEVDWYYMARSLKIGGKLLLDDIPIPAVAPVFRHMRLEPNWRLEGIFDDRAAAFTLLAPPAPEDGSLQPFNKGYPDFSYAAMPQRLRLEAAHRLSKIRHRVAERYPGLRRIYQRMS
jgi:hypothetical protein